MKNNLDQFKLNEFTTNADTAFKSSKSELEGLCSAHSNDLRQPRQVKMDFLRVKFKPASNNAASSLQSTLSKYRPIKKKEEPSGGLLRAANRQDSSSQIELQRNNNSNESASTTNPNDEEHLKQSEDESKMGSDNGENNTAQIASS
jgi:hypothetical protein